MKRLLGLLALSLILVFPTAHADYVAYATVDGQKRPLPENIDDFPAKDLVRVTWGKYSGNKARVGVLRVQNNSKLSSVTIRSAGGTYSYEASTGGVPVDGIEAILTDVLHRSGRFRVVERTVLDKTFKEQDLVTSGRISKPSGARTGKTLGAQYLIQAVVTSYEPNYQGKNIGIGGLLGGHAGALLGGLSIKSKKSMVAMNFRLVDAETSEVVFTKQVESIIDESGLGFGGLGIGHGGALGGFMSSYSKTPIGLAVIAAINKGVYELVKQVGAEPVQGTVIKASRGKVYLNLGKGMVKKGDVLTLMSKGESLIDPETGLDLGSEGEEIGSLQVITVKKKYSIAKPVGRIKGKIRKGYKVISTAAPAQLQFAAAWNPPKKKSSFSDGGDSSSDDGDSDDDF